MKRLIIIFIPLLLIGVTADAQTNYQPLSRKTDYPSLQYSEDFKVTFERTAYGLFFKSYDPVVDDHLKKWIKHFMKKQSFFKTEYQGMGKLTLRIVKKTDDDHYYVVYKTHPLELLRLDH